MTHPATYTPVAAQTSGLAIVSLIAGILSWTVAPILASVVAVITGHLARREIASSGGRLTGDLPATFGLVLGWVNLLLAALGACLVLGLLALGLVSLPFLIA